MSARDDQAGGRSVFASSWLPVAVVWVQLFVLGFNFHRLGRGTAQPWNVAAQCAFACFLVVKAVSLLVRLQKRGLAEGFPRPPDFFLERPLLAGFAVLGLVLLFAVGVAWMWRWT